MNLLKIFGFGVKEKQAKLLTVEPKFTGKIEIVLIGKCIKKPTKAYAMSVELDSESDVIIGHCPHCCENKTLGSVMETDFGAFSTPDKNSSAFIRLKDLSFNQWGQPKYLVGGDESHFCRYVVVRDINGTFIPDDVYRNFIGE